MSITVTEKEHWKRRLELRIDRKILALIADSQPAFLDDVKQASQVKAKKILGISKDLEQVADLESKQQEYELQARRLKKQVAAKVKGVTESSLGERSYMLDDAIQRAIDTNASHARLSIMQETELGRKILRLESEKENLLDTIWLATSSKQVKQLWTALGELLETTPTSLQMNALESDSEA